MLVGTNESESRPKTGSVAMRVLAKIRRTSRTKISKGRQWAAPAQGLLAPETIVRKMLVPLWSFRSCFGSTLGAVAGDRSAYTGARTEANVRVHGQTFGRFFCGIRGLGRRFYVRGRGIIVDLVRLGPARSASRSDVSDVSASQAVDNFVEVTQIIHQGRISKTEFDVVITVP